AVVEINVDPDILVRRIENRVEQAKLRGETLRADDSPEVLKQRLVAYEAQTAPLVKYYRGKGALRTVDGMAPISDVSVAIGAALADAAFRPVQTSKKTSGKPAKRAAAPRPQKGRRKAAKMAPRKAPKSLKKPAKRPGRRG